MKVNSTLEIVSQIVTNNLDTFDALHIHLALVAMMNEYNNKFVIDGNGGEGKTTFAFRLAVSLSMKGYFVFFLDLKQQSKSLTRKEIEKFIYDINRENSLGMKKIFLFIDNPCANLKILGWIHDEIAYQFPATNVILVERINRLKMLFNSNANYFPEWEDGLFYVHLRNTEKKKDGQDNNKDELWINRSIAMRRNIIEKMVETIDGINMQVAKTVFRTYLKDLLNDKNVTVAESMFYFKFKYNELIKERNLSVNKRIPLDWDEWDELITKYKISTQYGYGYIAALYLFNYEYPVDILLKVRPEFLSVLNTMQEGMNVEPMIYSKEKRRLYPKHEAVAEMFFRFCNIDDITEFLVFHFSKFSYAMQKVFIVRVMRKQYIFEGMIEGLRVNFDRVFEVIQYEQVCLEMPDQIALISFWLTYRSEEADITEIRKLVLQYPYNQDIWKEYVSICLEHNNLVECEKGLRSLLQLDSDNYWTLRFVATVYHRMLNTEQAVKYLYIASKKSINRLLDYRRIEKILEESGTRHELIKVRYRIIEMDYKTLSNYLRLDNVLVAENRVHDCYENYEYAQHYFTEHPWGYEKMIELAFSNGHFRRAFKNIRKYYFQFHLKEGGTQLKMLHYWTLMCWCGDEYIEEVRQLAVKNKDIIIKIWEHTKNESVLRWIFLMCVELNIENILTLSNNVGSEAKNEIILLLTTIGNERVKSFNDRSKVYWPVKYLDAIFNESKVYFRGQALFWSAFIRFVYHLFARLLNVCNKDPYLEKTLYWDMKPQMQKWTFYAMQRFLDENKLGYDEILNCTIKYEIILFLTPFHWYEKYFHGKVDKINKLEKIVKEKQKIIVTIQKIYTKFAKKLLEDREEAKANKLLKQIVERYPRNVQYISMYIKSFIGINNSEEVYRWYLYALNLCKTNLPNELFCCTVDYFMKNNNEKMTEKVIQAADGIISDRKQIKIYKMKIYLQKGELDNAKDIAIELQNSGKLIIQACTSLYQIYCLQGDMQRARDMAYYGVDKFPKAAIAYLNLADYFRKTGEKERALKICTDNIYMEWPDMLKMGKELCCELGQYKRAVTFYNHYCRCIHMRTDLKRLSYEDIVEGLYRTKKVGYLKTFLKSVRRRYGCEKVVQEYMSKICNLNESVWEKIK